MKHILEYEEHEIRDLLGDLEGVGQSRPVQTSIWLEYLYGKAPYAISKILTTEKFYASGDKDLDSSQVLRLISEGKFSMENPTREIFKGKASTSAEIPELIKREIEGTAKAYLSTKDLHNSAYKNRNLTLGEDKNFLDAFAHYLGLMSNRISIDRGDFEEDDKPEVHYKVYIAPPGSDCHKDNNFYTLPNPVDVVEYKD